METFYNKKRNRIVISYARTEAHTRGKLKERGYFPLENDKHPKNANVVFCINDTRGKETREWFESEPLTKKMRIKYLELRVERLEELMEKKQ